MLRKLANYHPFQRHQVKFWIVCHDRLCTPPKLNMSPLKMVVGRRSFPISVTFQGRPVKLRGGNSSLFISSQFHLRITDWQSDITNHCDKLLYLKAFPLAASDKWECSVKNVNAETFPSCQWKWIQGTREKMPPKILVYLGVHFDWLNIDKDISSASA